MERIIPKFLQIAMFKHFEVDWVYSSESGSMIFFLSILLEKILKESKKNYSLSN